jgi:hypothetical protein
MADPIALKSSLKEIRNFNLCWERFNFEKDYYTIVRANDSFVGWML